jgi:tetratricopeptide (TPR) repeat protein
MVVTKKAFENCITVMALLCSACLVGAAGQQLRLEDVPPIGLSPQAVDEAPLDEVQRATIREAVKSRDYLRAETLLADQIKHNPKSPSLLTLLGRILFLDGKYLNSAIAMKKADALAPLNEHGRFTLAMAYVTLKHGDWARPELDKLAQSSPGNALYPYWLSRLDYDAQKFSAALAEVRKAIELDPGFAKAYDNLGLDYEALGQYDCAIGAFQESIRLSRTREPHSPWPLVNLGTLLIKLGRLQEAESHLKGALQIDPRFAQAHYQLGLLFEKEGKDAEALRTLEQAADLNSSYAEPYYSLGKIYRRLGQERKAKAAFETFERLKKEKLPERPRY